MRTLLLICGLWIPILCVSQNDKIPTQKELEAQKQEAIKDIRQQIVDLKKDIAEAKAKGENPESIRDLEKQLTTLEQMLGILSKDFFTGKPEPGNLDIPKKQEPKFISPIVSIALKQQVLPPSEEQAKDELLWYKGKKINDTTIITTQNTVVQYHRRRHTIIVQVDKKKDTTALKIAANLVKCRQWTTQYIDNLASTKNIFFEYPEIILHLNEFDFLEKSYRTLIKNTIDLPIPENTIVRMAIDKKIVSGPSLNIDDSEGADNFLRLLYDNMMKTWNMMTRQPITPRPPNHPLWDICTTCNEKDFEAYKKTMEEWQNNFTKYEMSVLEKIAAVKVWMAKEGITYATSGIPALEKDIKDALDQVFIGWDIKLTRLINNYGSAYSWTPIEMDAVIENILLLQTQKKNYYGYVDEKYTKKLTTALREYEDRITEKYEFDMKNNSYVSVLNTRLIHAYDWHYKIFFGTSALATNASSKLQNLLQKIKGFNRFLLTVDIDFDFDMRDETAPILNASGKLSTSGKIYVSLGKAKDCKWQLYLTNTDYTDLSIQNEISFRIPMEVISGVKYTFYRNPVRAVMAEYKGPKDMLLVFPYTSIDFCRFRGAPSAITKYINDTIILESLRYKQEDLSQYQPSPQQYSVDLLQHVDKMFLSVEKVAEDYKDLLQNANQMMMVAMMGKVDKTTGFQKLDKIQIDFKKNGEQRLQQKSLAAKTHFGNTILLFKADNLPELVNVTRTLSNTELFGGYNMKNGNITLKIVHDPQ